MAPFVYQGKQIPQPVVLIIKEDIRPACVAACRECTGAFSFILILIYPAPNKPLLKHSAVFVAQRSYCFDYLSYSLFVGMLNFYGRSKRHIDIIMC